MSIKIIAITLGDPQGIGPEIIEKSLSYYLPKYPILLIGNLGIIKIQKLKIISSVEELSGKDKGIYFLEPYSFDNISEPSFRYVKTAVDLALNNKIKAIVTGPIAKEKWRNAGIKYNGHTEYLARSAGIKDHSMFFWSKNLKVSLYTTHIPLKKVHLQIKKEKIINFLKKLDYHLTRLFATKFRFLIPGFNPHAGENGFLGNEEIKEIIPAINRLRPALQIEGPFPADTIFIKALNCEKTVIVSWYHDQGLIPFKLLNIHNGVNLTLGLPFIRTSPDHGIAADIAGKGVANPASMIEAIKLTESLLRKISSN